MTPDQKTPALGQNPLAELFGRYLNEQLSGQAAGFAPLDSADVTPHEAVPAQPVDPRLAWDGAVAALAFFNKVKPEALQRPDDWATLAAIHEPAAGLAFAAGNFPQLLRNLQPVLQAKDL